MTRFSPSRFASVPVIALATLSALASLHAAQQAAPPATGSAPFGVLLRAQAGSFVVADGTLTPARDEAPVPLFVQADAYGAWPAASRCPS